MSAIEAIAIARPTNPMARNHPGREAVAGRALCSTSLILPTRKRNPEADHVNGIRRRPRVGKRETETGDETAGHPCPLPPSVDRLPSSAPRYARRVPFITFEGVEGSGKSTQLKLAAQRLGEAGQTARTTREPGGTPIAERIREILMDARHAELDPMTEWLLIEAARRQHLAEIVRPALAEGVFLLCDRFCDSTEAYQVAGRGLDEGLVRGLDLRVRDGLAPDLTLVYDLDPREGLARTRRRDAVEGRFESAALAFHERVRAALPRDRPARARARRGRGRATATRRPFSPTRGGSSPRGSGSHDDRDGRSPRASGRIPGAVSRRAPALGAFGGASSSASRGVSPRACSAPATTPTRRCGSCRRVDAGLHPDFLSVEPEGVQIRVDRVREALAFSAGRPYESARRVARILRADLLGIEAENALLKSLEEPGERFRWILTTSRPELLLSTIRSRCTPAALPAPSLAARQRAWAARGFSPEDARDLVLFAADDEADPASRLEQARELRQIVVTALEEGLGRRTPAGPRPRRGAPRDARALGRTRAFGAARRRRAHGRRPARRGDPPPGCRRPPRRPGPRRSPTPPCAKPPCSRPIRRPTTGAETAECTTSGCCSSSSGRPAGREKGKPRRNRGELPGRRATEGSGRVRTWELSGLTEGVAN